MASSLTSARALAEGLTARRPRRKASERSLWVVLPSISRSQSSLRLVYDTVVEGWIHDRPYTHRFATGVRKLLREGCGRGGAENAGAGLRSSVVFDD